MSSTVNRTSRSGLAIAILLNLLCTSLTAASAEDLTVATVNGAAITDRDLEQAIDRLIPRATFHGNVTEKKRLEFRDRALDGLIIRELQYQDAQAKGLKPDKKFVKSELKKVRNSYSSKREYRTALEQAGLTEDSLKARFEKDSLVKAVTDRTVTEPARIGAAALKEYYDKNITKFKQPDSVRLRIISTRDEKKAADILARIKAGEDFGGLAAKMSEDNYRIKGGDIGYIHRGRIYPAIEDVAFRLKQGEVSAPILTEGYWFIVKAEEKQAERQLSFDEVKDKLENDLEKKRAAELTEQWISELRAKAKIAMKPSPAAERENK